MGSYETVKNGQPVTVAITDASTLKDTADLLALLDGEFHGTPSAQSEILKSMLAHQQEGRPLTDMEWATLKGLLAEYGKQLAAFRASPEGDKEGFVPLPPEGTGRILSEASREDSGKFMGSSTVYDPTLLQADVSHASEAVQRLLALGRIRIQGQGPAAQAAAQALADKVGDKARVRTLAVKGNPYTQLTTMADATRLADGE